MQIEKFHQYCEGINSVSIELVNEATVLINLIKDSDLIQSSKIDTKKSFIFINKKDFGVEIFLLDHPEKRILFNYGKNETPLLLYENGKLKDCLFGQGVTDTCNYLINHLQNL